MKNSSAGFSDGSNSVNPSGQFGNTPDRILNELAGIFKVSLFSFVKFSGNPSTDGMQDFSTKLYPIGQHFFTHTALVQGSGTQNLAARSPVDAPSMQNVPGVKVDENFRPLSVPSP
jgi:hypothetical protein